jgi:hypothetical protein
VPSGVFLSLINFGTDNPNPGCSVYGRWQTAASFPLTRIALTAPRKIAAYKVLWRKKKTTTGKAVKRMQLSREVASPGWTEFGEAGIRAMPGGLLDRN